MKNYVPKHNPNDVALLMDIQGYCRACGHNGTARLVAYYSGEVITRCNHSSCKKAGQFEPSDETYNDPRKFLPFLHDDGTDAGVLR